MLRQPVAASGPSWQTHAGHDLSAAFAHLCRLPIDLVDESADTERAFELSRRYDEHPIYDLVYVAVAERLVATFITADARLLERVGGLPFVLGV